MPLCEHVVTEGNEKADEQAKDGAMMDGGVMVQRKERRFMRICNVHPSFSVW